MKIQRLAIALTAINLLLLLLTLARAGSTTALPVTPIVRARAFELVDGRGQVRSRLNVEPNDEVVLRLLDRNGTIRVKLGAAEDGSGLVLLDEATEPAIHIIARRTGTSEKPTTTSLTLRGMGGRQRVIRP
ncbi:MAG: hypothetical protein A2V98_19505 [Planctomycetes bacterium RBG_16_64_12]|nr:MAG: hypothetical protein A2V98_19505 [Planctomycetes bacterium RBG_16_64_12]